MGYRGDYIATPRTPEDVALALDLILLGPADDPSNASAWIGRLKNGWTVFVPDCEGYCDLMRNALRGMSEDVDVLACSVNETVMFAEATGYHKGLKHWHVSYTSDVEQNEEPLVEEGLLPASAAALKSALRAETAPSEGDDLFEYPIRIFESETGYCYDAIYDLDAFETLQHVQLDSDVDAHTGLLNRLIARHPLLVLLLGFLLVVVFGVFLSIAAENVLDPLISFVLGDWADVCLSNCADD
ncbi:hypothetical protein SAMN04488030_2667 [Aliiroseovarius halocynthiae]|uniref:Uncharacterized protein n=1 Tax=Aliiroseovarius halocynthiae TaxID=985055 RepID=A0A545SPD8_9RHOB|nr:hypothetical protein [Aliiroseovarius halocynthiae]TQV66845.1 hypothetical protein FIL88_12175 [Aliiroseovarius halocynthiae]SMR82318.1 hypothetical protein SAMN04488030_2667 [Aliiroseovarius halocynthiae]